MSKKNRQNRCIWLVGTLLLVLSVWVITDTIKNTPLPSEIGKSPSLSPPIHSGLINEILDTKMDNFDSKGYFPQIFHPSLQATYYALAILDEIERLNTINQTYVKHFIMAHYNSTSHVFMDDYARRYLDIDITKKYYHLSSLLEVNCYAILSLDILDSLNLIDIQDSIDFVWSCYNPVTSGFIGQPYDGSLAEYFKIATMDNSFFAILTLDLLMADWNNYLNEKNELIQYINSLQSINTLYWYFGGFYNDDDTSLDTLSIFEPNLLSSYYCIKSLEIFDMVDTIRINDFYQYLDGLYHTIWIILIWPIIYPLVMSEIL